MNRRGWVTTAALLGALGLSAPSLQAQNEPSAPPDAPARPAPADPRAAPPAQATGTGAAKPDATSPAKPVDPRAFPKGISTVDGKSVPAASEVDRYPEGVTVVTPRTGEIPPVDTETYPEGVTVLGGARTPSIGPRMRVVVEPRLLPPAPIVDTLPPEDTPAAGGVTPALGPANGDEGRTIGPPVDEQQAAFGRPPREAGGFPSPFEPWTPVSGFPEAPPNPAGYDREPARWFPPIRDPAWTPRSSWADGQDQRNWSPSRWIGTWNDPVWQPSDSWGRTLAVPDPLLWGRAPLPEEASRPAQANAPSDAGTPRSNVREQTVAPSPTDEPPEPPDPDSE